MGNRTQSIVTCGCVRRGNPGPAANEIPQFHDEIPQFTNPRTLMGGGFIGASRLFSGLYHRHWPLARCLHSSLVRPEDIGNDIFRKGL
jgi:hypothetical protein